MVKLPIQYSFAEKEFELAFTHFEKEAEKNTIPLLTDNIPYMEEHINKLCAKL